MVAKFLRGWCAVDEESVLLVGDVCINSYTVRYYPWVLEVIALINWSVSLF